MTIWDFIVIGAGPAGLMAATCASQRGLKTLLLEKRRRCGTKLLLSGGTRCNVTHDTDPRGIVEAFGRQGRFLHSALAELGPQEMIQLLRSEGVRCKVEPGGKVFPASDRAADILDVLLRRLHATTCTLSLDEAVEKIEHVEGLFRVITTKQEHRARNVLIATGGKSYPASGSTGDGYAWAEQFGHTIVPPQPALTPITTHATWVTDLRGITLPDISARVLEPNSSGNTSKVLGEARGALLFAHFGVTGPVALDLSRFVSRHDRPNSLILQCDFLPDLKSEALASQIQEKCNEAGKRLAVATLCTWLPRGLIEAIAKLVDLPMDRRGAELTKSERQLLTHMIKHCDIPVAGVMGFRKAEVTSGGISLKEVDSRTVQSKLVRGLYFAGEVLDLDGPIGGYNFQAAFSTGMLVGNRVE